MVLIAELNFRQEVKCFDLKVFALVASVFGKATIDAGCFMVQKVLV